MQNVELANRSKSWPTDIVTSGMVLFLDANNTNSYPGSGTIWYDLTGNGNTGTLTNGPTFSQDFAGILRFDTTDDALGQSQLFNPSIRNGNISGETPNIDFELTFEIVFRFGEVLDSSLGSINIFRTNATSFGAGPPQCLYRLSITDVNSLNSAAGYYTTNGTASSVFFTTNYNINQWYHVMMSIRKTSSTTGEWLLIRNGVVLSNQVINDISWWSNFSSTLSTNGNRISASSTFAHDRSIMRLYNRGLSESECLQNFNSIRDRFKI